MHIFGAYFGLTVAKILSIKRETESEKEGSNYNSDLFSMIGRIIYFNHLNKLILLDLILIVYFFFRNIVFVSLLGKFCQHLKIIQN